MARLGLQLFPANASGPWAEVARGTVKAIREEIETGRMSLRAGGIAFFAFLSAFPVLALLGALYGLMSSRAELTDQLEPLSKVIPGGVAEGLTAPLLEIHPDTLELGALLSLLTMVWASRRGALALLRATNLAYEIENQRNVLKLTAAALVVSIVVVLGAALTVLALSIVPWLLESVGLSARSRELVNIVRWPAVYLALAGFISFIYWYGPNRPRPRYRRTLPAASVAAGMLLLVSWLTTWALATVIDQQQIYGPVASMATLLLWLYISSWVFLMCAELSYKIERTFA